MKTQTAKSTASGATVRALAAGDLDAVVAIDAALGSGSRRAYFERRLAAARRDPDRHLQLAVEESGLLEGFMLGRVLEGEFGRTEPALRLEAFGVGPAAQGRGVGATLAAGFEAAVALRGPREIRTTARWREHALLRFLDHAGYKLAESHVLDCPLERAEALALRERPAGAGASPGDANYYGSQKANDFEPLARDVAEVGLLRAEDIEGVARIDRRLTGRDRRGFLCRAFAETLADSALRVSLCARADGAVSGYLMARLDYGDFGRPQPAAVIDTLGVDPLRARSGIGSALLSQLVTNLSALHVERMETIVAPGNLELLGFFHAAGLRTSERLAFVKSL